MPTTNEPSDVFKLIDIGPDDQCWRWLGTWGGRSYAEGRRPYFMAGRQRKVAYRWVFELMNGVELTRDQLVMHTCDNGDAPIGCCNYLHLKLGTNQANM